MHHHLINGLKRAAFLLGIVLVAGACASGARSTSDPFSGGGSSARSSRESRDLRIEVQNNNFNQATVEARGIGAQRRLGRVGGNESARFTLDWGGGPLYFEIDFLGGGTCTTRAIDVSPGESVRLTIDAVARLRADGMSRLCDAQRGR